MSVFVFKQFALKQELSAMKVGTDSVLLGCLCEPASATNILDIGTGTGLLALMMAQRSNAAQIDAVEIDETAALEAIENVQASPWAARIRVHVKSIQEFAQTCQKRYDCIITNPPYYEQDSNHHITDEMRTTARQTAQLGFEQLAEVMAQLLAADGTAWMILPTKEALHFREMAVKAGLFLHQEINIQPNAQKAVNRVIMAFGRLPKNTIQQHMVIYESNGQPTEQYKQLAKDFYTGKQFA